MCDCGLYRVRIISSAIKLQFKICKQKNLEKKKRKKNRTTFNGLFKILVVRGQRLDQLGAKIKFLKVRVLLHFASKKTVNWSVK